MPNLKPDYSPVRLSAFLESSPWSMEPKALGEMIDKAKAYLFGMSASPSAPLPSEKTDIKKKKSKPKSEDESGDENEDEEDDGTFDELDETDDDGDPPARRGKSVMVIEARVPYQSSMEEDEDGLNIDDDGICTIDVTGPLTKEASFYSWLFGGTSTDAVVADIAKAEADPAVKGILLNIDSPGGQAAGMVDLFNAVNGTKKPTASYLGSVAASAAYWCAAGSDMICAGPLSLVGSIGTYMVVPDTSKAAAAEGVKVNVVSSGGMKGAGVPGTKVTQEQLDDVQRVVNEINAHFIDGVAQGRSSVLSRDRVNQLADGRVHVGAKAVDIGLVDKIGTVADAKNYLISNMEKVSSVADLRKHLAAYVAEVESEAKAAAKAENDAAVKAAEVKGHEAGVASERERVKLLAECPLIKSDTAFVLSHVVAGSELGAAKTAYADVLAGKVVALEKAAAEAKDRKQLAEAAHPQSDGAVNVPQPGKNPANDKPATPAAAKAAFNSRVNELVEKNKMSRKDAVAYISKNEPAVYEAMMASYNPAK